MSTAKHEPQIGSVRPYDEIPRMGIVKALRNLLAYGGGRVDMRANLDELFDAHGPVVVQLGGPLRFVNLFGPEANRFVLLDREEIFSARRPWTMIMGRIFPNGLLLRDGDLHRSHRMIMREAFKRPVLRAYVDRMNPMIEDGLARWPARGGAFLAYPAFKELTLEIASHVFVGVELDTDTDPDMNVAFENMVAASMSRIRLRIPGLEFNRGLEGRDFMVRMLSSMLAATREGSNTDMFSLLSRARTEDGDSLGDTDVIDHMIFLMMAAHDTTTSTLSSVVYELAAHPEWQERVREECLGAAEQPSFDGLDELTGLTWVMREALRLYPPLPVIPRVATRDCEFGGFRIPADTMVIVSPIHTHRMPEWWSDPGLFDPERFSPLRAEDRRHTHNWVPFGGGAHVCIGRLFAEAQVRLILHHMVRRYRWSIPDGYVMPVQQAPISKPRDGLPIELKPI